MSSEISNFATSQTINTRITEVTVYTNQALVTRRGTTALTGEERELIITGLPLTIQVDSVRVRGTGIVPVRLLGVRTEKVFATEFFAKRFVQVSQQIRQLEEQQRHVQDLLKAVELQQDFVQGLGEKSVERFSGLLSPEQINLDEVKAFLNFLGQHYSDYAKTIAQREREQQELDKQLEALRQQRQQMQQTAYRETLSSYSIFVIIEPSSSGDFELEISYLVNRAMWTPVYDLRMGSISKQVNLSYLGEIRQKTGEDWTDISLTISTAKPALEKPPHKIKPWYISSLDGKTTGIAECSEDSEFAELEALLADESDAAKKQNVVEVQKAVAQAAKAGYAVTFSVDGNYTIPTDAAPHQVTVFSHNYPCRTEYVAVPRLFSFAYLEATVKNRSKGTTLLPGKANIFRDNMLVGTTQLEKIAPGEEFKLNLGSEESLKIDRELIEREVELIGSYRRTIYGYRLTIENLRDRKTTLKLIEQLPVSRNEQIKVHLLQTKPEIHLGEMGQLEWFLTLQRHSRRGSKQELYYQFAVEHPTALTVVNLEI